MKRKSMNDNTMRLRLKEAFAYAADNGKKINRGEIAATLWPDSSQNARVHNLCNLENGYTDRVKVDWVVFLSKYCGCTADKLFGLTSFPNIHGELK